MKAYYNGQYMDFADIAISPKDLGFCRAYSVYEALTTIGTKIFEFDQHYARMLDTLEFTHIQKVISKKELMEIITKLIIDNDLGSQRSSVKIFITGGYSPNGFVYVPGNESVIIYVEPAHTKNPEHYSAGVALKTQIQSAAGPAFKTNNYLTTLRYQDELAKSQAFELLWITADGYVLECSTSSIACVRDSQVYFPVYDDAILSSITVLTTKKLLNNLGIPYHEMRMDLDTFLASDEIFSLASFKDILPVTRIDNTVIGAGVPGKMTQQIMAEYEKLLFQG